MRDQRRPTIAVVVLATRGGGWLAAALARAAWADGRVVLDPTARIAAAGLPADVRLVCDASDVAEVTAADWIVVLTEDEVLAPDAAARIVAAVADAAIDQVFRLPMSVRALGFGLRLGVAPVRIARRGTVLGVSRHFVLGVEAPGSRACRLDVAVVRDDGGTLTEVVQALAAEARALATLAHRRAARGRRLAIAWAGPLAAARTLCGRTAAGPLGIGRWVLAVLAGYRVIVGHMTLWECRRNRVVELG